MTAVRPEVWITGIGVVTALGEGLEPHVRALRNNVSGLAYRNFFNGIAPDPVICGMVPESILSGNLDDTAHDRAERLLERAVKLAIDDAQLVPPLYADAIVGTTLGNMQGATLYHRQLRRSEVPDVLLVKRFILASPLFNVCARLGVQGRIMTISSACGSATTALGEAFHHIRNNKVQCVIAGGFEALSCFVVAGFNSLRLLSRQICRPFDRCRAGLNPAEGAAVFVCESSISAQKRGKRPWARIVGFGSKLDAYHYTRAHPEGMRLAQAIREAMATAQLEKEQIEHLHLHGTGTEANDLSEYRACTSVFGDLLNRIPASATKPITGHTFGASGAINALFSIISITEKIVPGTISLCEKDAAFSEMNLTPGLREVTHLSTSLSLSLGFGGEASALILAEVAA